MNMISTGPFLTGVDASEKKETLAEQFVSIWEKKNSKIARAGGISLMALSLAACGGSDDATAVVEEPAATTPVVVEEPVVVVEEPVVVEPVVVAPVVTALAADADATGTAAVDTFTATTATTTAATTLVGTNDISGGEGSDTLKLSMDANFGGFTVTGADTGSMTGVETVELTNAGSIARTFDSTGVSGVVTYKIDGTNGVVNVTDSADLAAIELSNVATGAFSITYAAPTGGTSPVAGTADTLNLTVESMGSATADISVTAVGVETLAVTSNAAATAAGGKNWLDLSGVSSSTTTTITGSADIDIASISAATTAVDASAVTGAVTLAATNAGAGSLTSIKTGSGDDAITIAHGDMTANATIDAGDGTDALTVTGAATNTTIWTVSSVESIDLSGVTGTATMSMKNSDAIADVALGNATSAYAGILTLVSDSGAKNFDVLGGSSNSLSTDTAGAVDIDVLPDADATTTSAETSTVDITAASATSLNIHVSGETDWTGTTSAAKAASVTLENASGRTQALDVVAAAAETLTITSNAESTSLANNSDFTGAKTITINTAGAFQDSSGVSATTGMIAANSVAISGSGSKSAATFDTQIGATGLAYDLSITATGMKAGLTLTGGADAGSGALNINASAATGAVSLGAIDGGSVTVTAGTTGALSTGQIDGKTVTINGGDSLDGLTLSSGSNGTATGTMDITANTTTITGSELNANTADIVAQADGTAMVVTTTGGIEADLFSVLSTATVQTVTVSGDLGLGADKLYVQLANYTTKDTNTVSIDLSGVTKAAASDTQTAVVIDIDAEVTNQLSVTGSKGSNDTVNIDGAVNYATNGLTLSGVEKVIIDDAVSMDASTVSGQTIAFTGASTDVLSLGGSALADTITLTNLSDTAHVELLIDAGVGADTIAASAMVDTVEIDDNDTGAWNISSTNAKVASTSNFDVISGLLAGDIIDLTGAVQTEADYDTFTTAAAAADLTATATTNTIAQFIGTYNSTTNQFTSDATGDDLMLAYNGADASDTTVDEAFILVGMTNVLGNGEITNGVITIA
jgi:hypothetical protein